MTTSRKANAIKHGSYGSINVKNESKKKTGYADLIYWTDKKVYVWEIKHKESANYRSSRPSAESTGPAQLKNYIKYLTKQLRAKGDKREVVAGFKFPLAQSAPSAKGNELITVRSSSKAAGIEVYTYMKVKKIDKPSPSPVPQPNPTAVPERVPQPANPYIAGAWRDAARPASGRGDQQRVGLGLGNGVDAGHQHVRGARDCGPPDRAVPEPGVTAPHHDRPLRPPIVVQ